MARHKLFLGLVLLLLLLVTGHSAGGQAPQAPSPMPQNQTAATPVEPPPIGAIIKKTVGFLKVSYLDPATQKTVDEGGTVFFVSYPETRLGPNRSFIYLVTNRHVIEPGIESGHPYQVQAMAVRINRVSSDQTTQEQFLSPQMMRKWHFPADASVDLAVLGLVPDQAVYDYVPLPLSLFATEDVVKAERIAEGDQVLFTGFFYQIPGMEKFEPIVREGILAMIPYEELPTTLNARGHIYLADVRAFHGNSGSPLLVNIGGLHNGILGKGYDYRLLGVVSGFYHEDANLTLTLATTLTGTLEENSGIAAIVPADELKKLLDSPELTAERDAEVEVEKSRK